MKRLLAILTPCLAALALVWVAPMARADETIGDKADKTAVDAKKTGRAVHRKGKKAARKATGNDNVVDDAKDRIDESAKNAKDDVKHTKRKLTK